MRIDSFVVPLKGTVIIAGSNGLIGGSILNHFSSSNFNLQHLRNTLEIVHTDVLLGIKELLSTHLELERSFTPVAVTIIYACGKGGFGISELMARQQIALLSSTIKYLKWRSDLDCCFVLVSSLGAHLSSVHSNYKSMVQQMEQIVLEYEQGLILRLPGIWGFKKKSRASAPCGLIAHLLASAMSGQEAYIFGDLSTTRYYLTANTVGKSIAAMVKNNELRGVPKIQNFYSTSLHSISEIILLISRGLSRKVIFRLLPGPLVDRESLVRRAIDGHNRLMLESLISELKIASWKSSKSFRYCSYLQGRVLSPRLVCSARSMPRLFSCRRH